MKTEFLHPGARARQVRPNPSPAPPAKRGPVQRIELSTGSVTGTLEGRRWLHLQGAVGEARTEQFMGREMIVVPVVMLVEGVVWPVTSEEKEFVPASVLRVAPMAWDGEPVLVNHPSLNGERVQGNHPRILETMQFGTLFNTQMVGAKLGTEAWLDPERAEQVGREALRYLERLQDPGDQIEVSVGAFVVAIQKQGTFKGEEYGKVWKEVYPDHLAFLPEGTEGACNADMGCGAMRQAMRHLVTAQGFVKERTDDSKTTLAGRAFADDAEWAAFARAFQEQGGDFSR